MMATTRRVAACDYLAAIAFFAMCEAAGLLTLAALFVLLDGLRLLPPVVG